MLNQVLVTPATLLRKEQRLKKEGKGEFATTTAPPRATPASTMGDLTAMLLSRVQSDIEMEAAYTAPPLPPLTSPSLAALLVKVLPITSSRQPGLLQSLYRAPPGRGRETGKQGEGQSVRAGCRGQVPQRR